MSNTTNSCRGTSAVQTSQTTQSAEIFHPQCDSYETKDGLVVVADMPGAATDSIEVTFERGILTIRGRVTQRTPSKLADEAVLLREYGVGDYYRSFRVAAPIDPAGISASYAQGVLTVRLPRHEQARQRKIPVTTN
jgi:HSP20 family protein